MTISFEAKKELKKIAPAIVHVDNTSRVQAVSKKHNLKFYKLINEFFKITKVPILLNTSFNVKGEPIVCSPNDAIRTFYSTGLDELVLNNYLIKKK
jgi:carbamoyltransferase